MAEYAAKGYPQQFIVDLEKGRIIIDGVRDLPVMREGSVIIEFLLTKYDVGSVIAAFLDGRLDSFEVVSVSVEHRYIPTLSHPETHANRGTTYKVRFDISPIRTHPNGQLMFNKTPYMFNFQILLCRLLQCPPTDIKEPVFSGEYGKEGIVLVDLSGQQLETLISILPDFREHTARVCHSFPTNENIREVARTIISVTIPVNAELSGAPVLLNT